MNGTERRFYEGKLEVRADGVGNAATLVGYAAVFNHLSVDLGGFREVIRPGAFTGSLARQPDVRAVVEHGGGLEVLGRTTNGTLRLAEDDAGLRVEIEMPDTLAGRDTMTLVRRGDLSQMSFAFRVPQDGDRWTMTDSYTLRELLNVDIHDGDVSVVAYPAYPATSVEARARMGIPEVPAELRGATGAAVEDTTMQDARRAPEILRRRLDLESVR